MMPGGHGNENPNANYMNGRGFWVFYVLVVAAAHLILLSVPINGFSVPWVWTTTNVGHNAVSFWVLHWVKNDEMISSFAHMESYDTFATDEVAPVDDVRPRHEPEADALGADRPWSAVHPHAQVPHHHTHSAIHPDVGLHETRQRAFRHK